MIVEASGRLCACGNRGCLERYVSLSAAQSALTGKPEGEQPVDPARLNEAFLAGQPSIVAWVDEAARKLMQAVITLENLLDPQTIIVGGMPRPILEAMIARMMPLPRSVSSDRPHPIDRLVVSRMDLDTPALGAATLPIFDSTAPEFALVFQQDAGYLPLR
jgi:predicted NBD/HSP70 family sugar kinase